MFYLFGRLSVRIPQIECLAFVHSGGLTGYEQILPFFNSVYGFDDAFKGRVGDAATLWMGRPAKAWFEARGIALPPELRKAADDAAANGATPLVFARGGAALGVIAVADSPKPDAADAIRALHGMGLRVLLLTGDNERTARAIADKVGIGEVIAGVLPDGKTA